MIRTKSKLIIIFILAMIIAIIFFFFINRWRITIDVTGNDSITMEYGEKYAEPGVTARLHGSLVFQKGWPVSVSENSTVDESKVGHYQITYTAKKLFLESDYTRKVVIEDTTPPVITLKTDSKAYTLPGHAYKEEGFSASDNYDGDVTTKVTTEEKDGIVTYTATDASGNVATATRVIKYDDPVPPEIKLEGNSEVTLKAGEDYTDAGFTADDNCDGDITADVSVSGTVDTYKAGTYELTYTATDSYGNKTTATRTVKVEAVRQPDTVTPSGKIIYLTFDDGPGQYTRQLLDILAKYNVKATFFVVNNSRYIDLLSSEAAAGHTVAIHTASHEYSQIYASEEAYFEDLHQMQSVIQQKTGIKPTMLRFPGGSSNTVSASYCSGIMTALTKDVTDQGYQYYDWNVSSGDAGETTDTDTVFQNVIDGVQDHDVSIVLQHDIKDFSVNAVEKIIVWGLAHGYTFLPLDSSSPTAHHGVNN